MTAITDEQIIKSLEAKVEEHLIIVKRYQDALEALVGDLKVTSKPIASKKEALPAGTFKDTVLDIFEKLNRPLTTREGMEEFNSRTSKGMTFNGFSGQFSALAVKGTIKKLTIETNPIASRYYYALPEWFDGEKLRQEYLSKI